MNKITEKAIAEKLSKHYSGSRGIDRELIKNEREDSHGSLGSVVYSLNGSPPKGYAISIPEIRVVNFYDHRGKRFRNMTNTVVKEPDSKFKSVFKNE